MSGPKPLSLVDLGDDALLAVLTRLDPISLGSISCVDRRLRALAASQQLWSPLCRQRWHHLNNCLHRTTPSASQAFDPAPDAANAAADPTRHSLHRVDLAARELTEQAVGVVTAGTLPTNPAAPELENSLGGATAASINASVAASTAKPPPASAQAQAEDADAAVDWRALFASGNGWREPHMQRQCIRPGRDFISAVEVAAAEETGLLGGCTETCRATADVVLLTTSDTLEAWTTGTAEEPPRQLAQTALLAEDLFYSLASLGGGCIAAGANDGRIQVFRLGGGESQREARLHAALLATASSPVVDMHYSSASGRLYALHDATFSMPMYHAGGPQRNVLRVWDALAQREVVAAHDFLESYELVCFAAQGGVGSEVVAGAVHTGFCLKCYDGGYPSLCCHKSPAHCAAICIFDLRVGLHMVQRYGTHHRSMYPALRTARGHFILTSHVGQPLSVWDKRHMSVPVYEEERLGNHPDSHHCTRLPFDPPSRPSEHQGLFLDTNGDQLVGRAENGITWVWDLSATLGWAAPAGRGRPGSWLCERSPHHDAKYPRFMDWPLPLGALACETSVPVTYARASQDCALVGLCSESTREGVTADLMGGSAVDALTEEFVTCASLL